MLFSNYIENCWQKSLIGGNQALKARKQVYRPPPVVRSTGRNTNHHCNWQLASLTTLSMIIYHQYLRQSGFTRYLVHYHIMPQPPPVVGTISGEKTNTGNHHHIHNNIINDNQYLHQGPRQIFSPSSLFVQSLERR